MRLSGPEEVTATPVGRSPHPKSATWVIDGSLHPRGPAAAHPAARARAHTAAHSDRGARDLSHGFKLKFILTLLYSLFFSGSAAQGAFLCLYTRISRILYNTTLRAQEEELATRLCTSRLECRPPRDYREV